MDPFHQLLKTKLIAESTSRDSLYSVDVLMQDEQKVVEKMGVPLTKLELTKLRKKLANERAEAAEGPAPKKMRMNEEKIEEVAAAVVIDVCLIDLM
jgi:ribosomal protein L29